MPAVGAGVDAIYGGASGGAIGAAIGGGTDGAGGGLGAQAATRAKADAIIIGLANLIIVLSSVSDLGRYHGPLST